MLDKNLLRRRGLLMLMLLLTALFQNTDGLTLTLFGARAFLLIPAAVFAGMFERSLFGAALGAFAGALWDISSAYDGFNAVFLCIAAFVGGLLISRIMRDGILTALTLAAFFTALYIVLYVLIFFVFAGVRRTGVLFGFYLPSFLYTAAVSPLQYFILKAVMNAADRPKRIHA